MKAAGLAVAWKNKCCNISITLNDPGRQVALGVPLFAVC